MKSTTGQHYAGLDHLRGIAAFLVVLWHFSRASLDSVAAWRPFPALGFLDEGHCGVALFMTLSGYLFAKLIGDRRIDFKAFLKNRAARLLPLLLVVIVIEGLLKYRGAPTDYAALLIAGMILPLLPNGGWSIITEIHFYLMLPLLLFAINHQRWLVALLIIASAIVLRLHMFDAGLKMNFWSYATLIGRIDQFVLGMVFARWEPGRATWWLVGGLWLTYALFDYSGGYYGDSNWAFWIILPTIEGLGFAALIRWYDARPLSGKWLMPVEAAGKYSYSIYLLHLFVIRDVANYVDQHVVALTNIFVTLPFATLFFAVMLVVGHYTYRWVEEPFLRRRRPYLLPAAAAFGQPPAGTIVVAATR